MEIKGKEAPTNTQRTEIELRLEEIAHHSEIRGREIDGILNYIAFKSEASYLIVANGSGFKLVDKNKILYERIPKIGFFHVDEAIYIKSCNCYFLAMNNKLYKKGINGQEPYLYMNLTVGSQAYHSIIYSEKLNRLIANINFREIGLVNLRTRRLEVKLSTKYFYESNPDELCDLTLCGDMDQYVVTITSKGFLSAFELPSLSSTQLNDSYGKHFQELELSSEPMEQCLAVSSSAEENLVLITTQSFEFGMSYASRFILMKINPEDGSLRQIRSMKAGGWQNRLFEPSIVSYLASISNKIYFIGIDCNKKAMTGQTRIDLLEFSPPEGEFRRRKAQCFELSLGLCYSMTKFRSEVLENLAETFFAYLVNENGRVIKLTGQSSL